MLSILYFQVTPTVLRSFRRERTSISEKEERPKSESSISSTSSKSSGDKEQKESSENWVVVDEGKKGDDKQAKSRSPSPEVVEKPIGLEKPKEHGDNENNGRLMWLS